MKIEPDSPQVKFPPPLVFVVGLAVGAGVEAANMLPARIDGLGIETGLRIPIGAFVAVCGAFLVAVTVGLFRRAGTHPPPWRPTTNLVFSGPYRFSRNPMYLGMAITYIGLAIILDSLMALLLLPPALLWLRWKVIAREEAYLANKFGEDYLSYKRRVRRWI